MKTDVANDFLVYVVEEYKFLEGKTAKEVVELFSKYKVFDYILNHYGALHTMGGRAIAIPLISSDTKMQSYKNQGLEFIWNKYR